MNVLVLSDNLPLLQRAKPLFMRHSDAKFLFTDSDAINPQVDITHILKYFDLVVSLHCKKIFPAALFDKVRCINVHPGFNPFNRGMYPHVWSIINGLPAGATIHEIDYTIDSGAIIAQTQVQVFPQDTSETLYERVMNAEMELLDINLSSILNGSYTKFHSEVKGNYNSLEDYNKLCDMSYLPNEYFATMRALSHGRHWNAHHNGVYFKLGIKP